MATRYISPSVGHAARWVFKSKEDTNFTYEISNQNKRYLAHFISHATNCSVDQILEYMDELENDNELKNHVGYVISNSKYKFYADQEIRFAKRLGWYALVRALKPAVVVETGVDKGLGSVVLCAALLRNGSGKYYGTDINPNAGALLCGRYANVGKILYGDSLASLRGLEEVIDLFINDSDHSSQYEREEYKAIAGKITDKSVIVADNAHVTSELEQWTIAQQGRKFSYWQEEPVNHWYKGAGIGLSYSNKV